jgi:hypothetical protein
MTQITQADRMICVQWKDIENKGGSPGAVIVVQVDYRAVSHAIGIVGVDWFSSYVVQNLSKKSPLGIG